MESIRRILWGFVAFVYTASVVALSVWILGKRNVRGQQNIQSDGGGTQSNAEQLDRLNRTVERIAKSSRDNQSILESIKQRSD